MAISYPISLPSSPTSRAITIRKRSVVANAVSPFSYIPQSYVWPGQAWAADITLPPMNRAQAEPWLAALASLNGMEGSFLLGDSANKLPRGTGLAAGIITSAYPAIGNGDMETAGAPLGSWIVSAGGSSAVTRDTGTFHSGTASAKLTQDGSGTFVAITSGAPIVGRKYLLTLWAKANVANVPMYVDDFLVNQGVNLTTAWTKYTFTIIPTYQQLRIFTTGSPGNNIWVDDVDMVPVETYGGIVNGGSQTGYDLLTKGWLSYQTGILKAGDWLQLGKGNTSRLYKVMADVNTGYNYFANSGSVANATWGKAGITGLAAQDFNPWDGSLTVDAWFETAAGPADHYSATSIVMTAAPWTISTIVKANGRSWIYLQFIDSASTTHRSQFDLVNGVAFAPTGCTAAVTALGNGYYQCSITFTPAAGAGTFYYVIEYSNSLATYLGDTTKGILVAHVQAEAGAGPGPRIITGAAAQTDTTIATLTLWPKINGGSRPSPADGDAITVVNPRGKFMLTQDVEWPIDEAHIYGLSFSAVEDLRP